jgi:hypothetical protein
MPGSDLRASQFRTFAVGDWSSACPRRPIKAHCTTGDYRRIARGNTRRCSGRCRSNSIKCRKPHGSAVKPSGTCSLRSKAGWGHAPPDTTVPGREHRNAPARSGLQHEARDADLRCPTSDASDQGIDDLLDAGACALLCLRQDQLAVVVGPGLATRERAGRELVAHLGDAIGLNLTERESAPLVGEEPEVLPAGRLPGQLQFPECRRTLVPDD